MTFKPEQSHCVELPHPSRSAKTAGRCDCGWTITYGWGGHDQAAESAGDHIRTEGLAMPVETQELSGHRRVTEGLSL